MKNLLTYILLILTLWGFAQVGINTETPSQMLDVEGRIEISDDNSPPTDGAIRYNATEEEFEGYAGTQWNSFTSRGLGFPSNAIPVYGYYRILQPNTLADIILFNYNISNNIGDRVPGGKYLLVTHILFENWSETLDYDIVNYVNVGPRVNGQLYSDSARRLKFLVKWSNNQLYSGDFFPLLIVKSGEYLTVRNSQTSQDIVNVKIKGFLVDDLNFN